jgi:predicted signal transduction protein with EAL and GGDEF domain
MVELRQLSIDDFATGFSALSYLQHFDVDYLKIDKSFINNLTEDGSDKALTEAIIDIAHRLGMEAIAEGVASRARADAQASKFAEVSASTRSKVMPSMSRALALASVRNPYRSIKACTT